MVAMRVELIGDEQRLGKWTHKRISHDVLPYRVEKLTVRDAVLVLQQGCADERIEKPGDLRIAKRHPP
jgi:hypothetical protein